MSVTREVQHATFAREEYERRTEELRREMERRELSAVLVTAKENVVYFSGLETVGWDTKHRPVGCVIGADGGSPILIIAESLANVARVTSWVEDVRLWGNFKVAGIPRDPVEAIAEALKDATGGSGRVGFELGYGTRMGMSLSDYERLRSLLPGELAVTDAAEALWAVRMIKSPAEINIMRQVCHDTCETFRVGFEALHAGMTERELAGLMYADMATRTNFKPGFIGIRSGRLKYLMMNVPPFDKPMEPGDLVVVDGGATRDYYWCDMMRMASIGEPTDEQRRLFEADLAAQRAGMAAVKPGADITAPCRAAYEVLMDAGLGDYVPSLERVGHGLGLDVHEPPSLPLDGVEGEIRPGMVLTVEPIFSDLPRGEIGNFAMEQILAVTEDGTELLTPFTDDLWVAPAA
jgi:Xaa-Pro aminopeptidase